MITEMLKNNRMYRGKELLFFIPGGSRVNISGLESFVIYELKPKDDEHSDYITVAVVAIVQPMSIFKSKIVRDIFIKIDSKKENIISYMGMNPLDHKFSTTDELLTVKIPGGMHNNKDMMQHIVTEELEKRDPTMETALEADDFEMDGVDFDDVAGPYDVPDEAWESGTQYKQLREKLVLQQKRRREAYEKRVEAAASELHQKQQQETAKEPTD